LVHHVRYEPRACHAPGLVIALEASLEIENESLQQQLANVRELGIDDGHESRIHVGKGWRSRLSLHDRLA
jgi:hypothetical protein